MKKLLIINKLNWIILLKNKINVEFFNDHSHVPPEYMPKRSRNWNRLFHQAAMAAVLLEMKFSVSGKMFWKEDPITDKSILRVLRKMKQKDLFTDEMEVLIDEITR